MNYMDILQKTVLTDCVDNTVRQDEQEMASTLDTCVRYISVRE